MLPPKYDFYQLKQAICHFSEQTKCIDNGYAILTQYPDKTIIQLDLYNLSPGVHGFHIHELGNTRQGCMSMGAHYNPFNNPHGGLNQKNNHLGDLGNIKVDATGRCNTEIIVNYLPLSGQYSVVGRGMVIHEGEDDLGMGHHKDSSKTGNSGGRMSCGIIGYL